MTEVNKTRLSASEICQIIQACANSQVASLKFGDLEVTFEPKNPWASSQSGLNGQVMVTGSAASLSGNEIPDAHLTNLAQETLEQEEIELRQEQLAQMPITDPLEYEEMLARGELVDASE